MTYEFVVMAGLLDPMDAGLYSRDFIQVVRSLIISRRVSATRPGNQRLAIVRPCDGG